MTHKSNSGEVAANIMFIMWIMSAVILIIYTWETNEVVSPSDFINAEKACKGNGGMQVLEVGSLEPVLVCRNGLKIVLDSTAYSITWPEDIEDGR